MKDFWILTAVGPDRPGLVDRIAEFLSEREINIESSRMAVLGGEFAFMVLVSGQANALEALAQSLPELEQETCLSIQGKKTRTPSERETVDSLPFHLLATSMDHPGIVHKVGRLLHRHNVNIESMDTHVAPAPVSGTPVFSLECRLSVPVEVRISQLREDLAELSAQMNVDIEFEPKGT